MVPTYYLTPESQAIINSERERIHAKLEQRREQRKREAEAKKREPVGRALAQQMGGWTDSAMAELIEIYKGQQ